MRAVFSSSPKNSRKPYLDGRTHPSFRPRWNESTLGSTIRASQKNTQQARDSLNHGCSPCLDIYCIPPVISNVAKVVSSFSKQKKWSLPNRGIGGYEPSLLAMSKLDAFLDELVKVSERSCSNFLFLDVHSWELLFFKKIWITPKCRCLLPIHHSFEWI